MGKFTVSLGHTPSSCSLDCWILRILQPRSSFQHAIFNHILTLKKMKWHSRFKESQRYVYLDLCIVCTCMTYVKVLKSIATFITILRWGFLGYTKGLVPLWCCVMKHDFCEFSTAHHLLAYERAGVRAGVRKQQPGASDSFYQNSSKFLNCLIPRNKDPSHADFTGLSWVEMNNARRMVLANIKSCINPRGRVTYSEQGGLSICHVTVTLVNLKASWLIFQYVETEFVQREKENCKSCRTYLN